MGSASHDRTLAALRRRLDGVALEQARARVVELAECLERAEADLAHLREQVGLSDQCAAMWQQHASDLEAALREGDFATHRCVRINQAGEMMVVRIDG